MRQLLHADAKAVGQAWQQHHEEVYALCERLHFVGQLVELRGRAGVSQGTHNNECVRACSSLTLPS